MKWTLAAALIAALLGAPSVTQAAPPKPTPTQTPAKPKLPACRPDERESWPVVGNPTTVEGRTVLVHRDPKTGKQCGEVQNSRERPRPPTRPKGKR